LALLALNVPLPLKKKKRRRRRRKGQQSILLQP
jgi:hypothetical protein